MISTQPHVRYMIKRDFAEVMSIEQRSFWHAWSEEDFLTSLRARNVIGMVAETPDGKVVAFMTYELHDDHLVLLRLAVDPDHRRQGVGRTLLEKVRSKLSSRRRVEARLEVSEYALQAHLWLRACGARATGVRGGNYLFVLPYEE